MDIVDGHWSGGRQALCFSAFQVEDRAVEVAFDLAVRRYHVAFGEGHTSAWLQRSPMAWKSSPMRTRHILCGPTSKLREVPGMQAGYWGRCTVRPAGRPAGRDRRDLV